MAVIKKVIFAGLTFRTSLMKKFSVEKELSRPAVFEKSSQCAANISQNFCEKLRAYICIDTGSAGEMNSVSFSDRFNHPIFSRPRADFHVSRKSVDRVASVLHKFPMRIKLQKKYRILHRI